MRVVVTVAVMSGMLGTALSSRAALAQSTGGKAAFDRICMGCHGPEGVGGIGPRLVPFNKDNRELFAIVREGSGQMPALSAADISDDEVAAVAEYLRSLSKGA